MHGPWAVGLVDDVQVRLGGLGCLSVVGVDVRMLCECGSEGRTGSVVLWGGNVRLWCARCAGSVVLCCECEGEVLSWRTPLLGLAGGWPLG